MVSGARELARKLEGTPKGPTLREAEAGVNAGEILGMECQCGLSVVCGRLTTALAAAFEAMYVLPQKERQRYKTKQIWKLRAPLGRLGLAGWCCSFGCGKRRVATPE